MIKSTFKLKKSTPLNWYGIDVSKDKLVIAHRMNDEHLSITTISNNSQSIQLWLKTLAEEDCCLFEHTGTYSTTLSYELHLNGTKQSIITPGQSKGFSSVLKNITKNDERDAAHLQQYGERMQPELYRFSSDNILKIRQFRNSIRQQQKALRVAQNQLHAINQLPYLDKFVAQIQEEFVAKIQDNISRLQAQINDITDDDFKKLDKKIQTVVGVGAITSQIIISATNGLEGFDTPNQVAKFAGVAPIQEQSGNYTAKAKINKNANSEIRSALYMASLSASRYNKACAELYQRLRAKGKPRKQALIAVAHKLIKQIWAVVKTGLDFDNDYH